MKMFSVKTFLGIQSIPENLENKWIKKGNKHVYII